MSMSVSNYKTRDDGKLHVNYSGLKRCTSPSATLGLVKEMVGDEPRFDNAIVQFGRTRHEMWQEQSERTGYIPEEFKHLYPQPVDFIEHAFAAEIFKDVILHFRPDAVCLADEAVVDYKKIVGSGRQFAPSKQLIIYAYGLMLHGHKITKRVYLCEKWNAESTEIIGYQMFSWPLTLADIALAPSWLKPRAGLLKQVNDQYLAHKAKAVDNVLT